MKERCKERNKEVRVVFERNVVEVNQHLLLYMVEQADTKEYGGVTSCSFPNIGMSQRVADLIRRATSRSVKHAIYCYTPLVTFQQKFLEQLQQPTLLRKRAKNGHSHLPLADICESTLTLAYLLALKYPSIAGIWFGMDKKACENILNYSLCELRSISSCEKIVSVRDGRDLYFWKWMLDSEQLPVNDYFDLAGTSVLLSLPKGLG